MTVPPLGAGGNFKGGEISGGGGPHAGENLQGGGGRGRFKRAAEHVQSATNVNLQENRWHPTTPSVQATRLFWRSSRRETAAQRTEKRESHPKGVQRIALPLSPSHSFRLPDTSGISGLRMRHHMRHSRPGIPHPHIHITQCCVWITSHDIRDGQMREGHNSQPHPPTLPPLNQWSVSSMNGFLFSRWVTTERDGQQRGLHRFVCHAQAPTHSNAYGGRKSF